MKLQEILNRLGACNEALDWVDDRTPEQAWAECERGDWMLWVLSKLLDESENSSNQKRLVLCTCACARTVLLYVSQDEKRPLTAIETAEAWARGENVSLEKVREAADAADAAAYTAAYTAADAAAYASKAAVAATAYAAAAAYAADAAAIAYAAASAASAAYAADAAARKNALQNLANIVREHYPEPPQL